MVPTEIFIYGASGHGKVIADIIGCSDNYTLAGWIDDNPTFDTLTWEKFRVLHPQGTVALGIGKNHTRELIAKKVTHAGYAIATLIHPRAVVSPSAQIGEGSVIMPLAIINADARIGEGCIINSGAIVEHDCTLDNYVHISPNVALAGGVHIKENTHIGIGANVIQNITIGSNSIVGAGSVVINDIADNVLSLGIPASVQKTIYKESIV